MSEQVSGMAVRLARAVPADERVIAHHGVSWSGYKPEPRRRHRPRVFDGLRMPGDRLSRLGLGALWFIGVPWALMDAIAERLAWGDETRESRSLRGGWHSEAGRLGLALRPRARTGVSMNLVLTDTHYRLVYVHTSLIGKRFGDAAECGWAADLSRITWIRDRGDLKGGTHELGFADGSQLTIVLAKDGWSRFVKALPPHKLGRRETAPVSPS